MTVDPRNLTVTQWTDAVVLTTDSGYSFGRLDDPEKWQAWAVKFCAAPGFAQRNPPNPYQFSDWKIWAMLAYPMLEARV